MYLHIQMYFCKFTAIYAKKYAILFAHNNILLSHICISKCMYWKLVCLLNKGHRVCVRLPIKWFNSSFSDNILHVSQYFSSKSVNCLCVREYWMGGWLKCEVGQKRFFRRFYFSLNLLLRKMQFKFLKTPSSFISAV